MNLMVIISVDFDVADQLLIRFSVFVRYWRKKWEYNETVHPIQWGRKSIQNGLIPGDALSSLVFNFALEYAIRKVQENQVGLKLNGAHHLLTYDDDVNLLRDNIDTINKNTETLIDAIMEVGLEVNLKKIKYMLLSRHQNACQNRHIK
jgi:hypothetical protein